MWCGLCVCVLGTAMSCAKTTESINIPFAADSRGCKEPHIRWVTQAFECILFADSSSTSSHFVPLVHSLYNTTLVWFDQLYAVKLLG